MKGKKQFYGQFWSRKTFCQTCSTHWTFSWGNTKQFQLQRHFYVLFIRNAIRHIWKWWGSREKLLLFIARDLRLRLPSVTSNHISDIIIPKPMLPSPWCTWQLGNGVQSGLPHCDVLNWPTNTYELPRKICLSLILIYISRGNEYPGTAVPVNVPLCKICWFGFI